MVMTIAKITAGDGYLYLLRHTARGDGTASPEAKDNDGKHRDATAYYTANGNPPGHWTGRGAPLLGLRDQEVTEDHMRNLFGTGSHPDAQHMISEYLKEHVRANMTGRQLTELREQAIRHATLGQRFPQYETLDAFQNRVDARLETIREQTGREPTEAEIRKARADESRRQRAAVAGFDLVFSPVKSAALLWAVDTRPEVRDAIRQAHQDAMKQSLDLIEDHAAFTRTGTGGVAQIETNGLAAAAFEHWDSRAGDPNLHTHVAVSSKVQGTDGKWRSLDARTLYRIAIAASETYNTAFETYLTASLGVTFVPRPDTVNGREPVREIGGVPLAMIEHFSRRRAEIERRYDTLLHEYREQNHHEPPAATAYKLAQQATLETRPGKQPPRSLRDRQAAWREELAGRFGTGALDRLMQAVPSSRAEAVTPAQVPFPDLHAMAERLVASVAYRRSTWTRWNARAEAERMLRTDLPGMTPGQHTDFAEILTDLAIDGGLSVCVEAPLQTTEPPELRRSDGESVFTEHGAGRFTSEAVLDAEERLLDATRVPTVNGLAAPAVAAAIDGFEATSGTGLDPGQRALVTAFATDDRLLLAGIGPAGAGKTTAMRAYASVLRQAGHRLIPLATSAASADILGRELSLPAENLHKFLYEWTGGRAAAKLRTGDSVPADLRPFTVKPGDVILVDEAGMAGTFPLDTLVSIATVRGATVRLLGDHRQLSAVESGGALRLVAAQPGTPELTLLHRFNDPEEAGATLRIRTGHGSAVDWYAASGRIRSGSRDAMARAAYDGWKADMLTGKTTLMAASDGTDVTELSAQARADRVAAGQVETSGVLLRDGNLAGAGDWIVTRHNDRRLSVCGGTNWVKNGDAWHVEQRRDDGSLVVKNMDHGGRVLLPADYVAAHVQLLYATTAHRAQGSTVDTAHPLVVPGMTREMLYVLASRAKDKTTLYVAVHEQQPFDNDDRTDQALLDPDARAAHEVLLTIVATEGAALSATETIETAQEEAESLARLVPEYRHAAHQDADGRYRAAANEVFGERDAQELTGDSAWGAVVRRLYDAEADGWHPATLLKIAADERELGTADSVAEVMSWRIDAIVKDTAVPPKPGASAESPAAAKARLADITATALGPRYSAQARSEAAWPALIAALRRAEAAGHDPGDVLAGTAEAHELRTARSISELLAWRVSQRADDAALTGTGDGAGPEMARGVRDKGVLPWVTRPPAGPAAPGTMPAYLADTADLISARVGELADRAIRERPAWMSMLGQQPRDPELRAKWCRHVAVIAAYRDQHMVTADDPRQVLGPYPQHGHAGHKPYWHAAESVLGARQVAGLDRGPGRDAMNATTAQVLADIYRALPQDERAAIAATVAAKEGILWLGDRDNPDEDAVVQPVYADQLSMILTTRGHLNPPEPARNGTRAQLDEPVEASLIRRGRGSGTSRSTDARQQTAPSRTTRAEGQTPGVRLPLQHPETVPHRPAPFPQR
jgi:conjugative relaxase-like TrwC/TraI family protein